MKISFAKLCVAAALICGVCQSHASLNLSSGVVNLDIPDNWPDAGRLSSIQSSSSDIVSAITSISFTISGGWDGDFTVVLMHTDGTLSQSTTLLSGLLGGAAANAGFGIYNGSGGISEAGNAPVTLSAAGSADIRNAGSSSSTAPITGTFGFSASGLNFDSFQGASAGGDWMLYITDNASGNSGTLVGWSLSFDTITPVPEPVNVALSILGASAGLVGLVRFVLRKKASLAKTA